MSIVKMEVQLLFQQEASVPFSSDRLLSLHLRVQKLKGEEDM